MMAPIFGHGWGKLAAPGVIQASSVDLTGCIFIIFTAVGPSGSVGMMASQAAAPAWAGGDRCWCFSWGELAEPGLVLASSADPAGVFWPILAAAGPSGSAGRSRAPSPSPSAAMMVPIFGRG
jgi:hypothetical protein